MQEIVIGLGLFLVIEGLAYALFPGGIKRVAREVPNLDDSFLRNAGLAAMAGGIVLIWLVKG